MSVLKKNSRAKAIDAAKGIGIILVVYGHVARGIHNAGLYQNNLIYYNLIDDIIYSFHMPLFFFISGLFFIKSYQKKGLKLILNKFDRILYPYIVWSIIQGIIEISLSKYTTEPISLGNLVTILWDPRKQFWFLYALFLIFVLNTIAFIFLERYIKGVSRLVFLIFVIGSFLFLLKQRLPDYYFLQIVVSHYVYFCFGILFWKLFNDDYNSIFLSLGLLTIFLFFEYSVYYATILPSDTAIMKLILAFSGILTVISICKNLPAKILNIVSFVGVYSLEIYLMHIIFGSGVRMILKIFFNIMNTNVHLILGVLAGLILPIVVAKVTQRVNFEFFFKPPRTISVENTGFKG